MARSLKVAPEHLARVNLALKRQGYPSQKQFAADVGPSLSTVKKFLKGEAIDYENFRELCERLAIDWQGIVYVEAADAPAIEPIAGELAAFNPSHPVPHPLGFFGRSREISRSFGLLKRRPLQNIAIIGPKKSGKTSLLKHLVQLAITPTPQLRDDQRAYHLPQSEQYKWIFVDLQDPRLATREGLIKNLLGMIGVTVDTGDLEQFMDLMSLHLQQPTVILLDEIGSVLRRDCDLDDAFWESLRSLASHYSNGNLGFVLTSHEHPTQLASHTGHSSPFFNIFGYATTLGPLSEPEAQALIASSPIAFSAADVEWILAQSEGWPFFLQLLCQYRLEALHHQESDTTWQEEGLQQIAFYRQGR